MKYTKKIIIPAKEDERLDYITCDFCSKKIETLKYYNYRFDDVKICRSVGTSYPEGGSEEETIVDMCPDCFESKLMPWVESQGIKFRKEERDY